MRLKSQHFIVVALFLPLIAAEFCAELSINCVLVSNRTVDENPFKMSHFFVTKKFRISNVQLCTKITGHPSKSKFYKKNETFYRFFAQNVELKTTQINVHSGRKSLQKVPFLSHFSFKYSKFA